MSPCFHLRKKNVIGDVHETSAPHKLFKRYTAIVTLLFTLSCITPWYTSAEGIGVDESAYFFEPESLDTPIIADSEGYLAKMNHQTDSGDRATMNDYVIHTIAPGETISEIAKEYGLKTETILWENDIRNAGSIRAGQELLIPPVDGVTHVVGKNENLDKIAQLYGIDREKIKEQNDLMAALNENDEILVPGGKPLAKPEPILVAQADGGENTQGKVPDSKSGTKSPKPDLVQKKTEAKAKVKSPVKASKSVSTEPNDNASPGKPVKGVMFIKPTKGIISCGYGCYPGHYALDIADGGKHPPVWAASGGTIIKASSGTYGGGYGTHVIIDHGNGYKTLYGHMVAGSLKVKVGDKVKQGQEIGTMGNTGRVFGRTGIHTHWEVIKDGVKINPAKFL